MVDNILKVLEEDEKCWITFKSMTSNAEHTHLYKKSGFPSKGNKLIVINVETDKLEDLEKDSIIRWGRTDFAPKWGNDIPAWFRTMGRKFRGEGEFSQSPAVQKTRALRKLRYNTNVSKNKS